MRPSTVPLFSRLKMSTSKASWVAERELLLEPRVERLHGGQTVFPDLVGDHQTSLVE